MSSGTTRIAKLAARTAAILLVAGIIVVGATAIGYSPLGSRLPGTFLPFGGDHGGPPPVVAQGNAPASDVPSGREAQGARGGGGPRGAGQNGSGTGMFTGRNVPSVQSGLRQEAPYLALFAAVTAAVALALRLRRQRWTRSPDVRLSGGG
jgi:hypothetical protein